MEILSKCAAASIFVSLACLLIKKQNPELSLAVSITLSVLILLGSTAMLSSVKELVDCAVDMLGVSSSLVRPILKCMGISLVSKMSADICRDASQSALASALELSGCFCAAALAMPVVINTLKMIGSMV